RGRIRGDGIPRARELGPACRTIHNNLGIFLGFHVPPDDPAEPPSFRLATIAEILCPHTMVVNRAGRRIGDESFFPSMVPTLRQFVTATHDYANLPCYLIFDSQFHEPRAF